MTEVRDQIHNEKMARAGLVRHMFVILTLFLFLFEFSIMSFLTTRRLAVIISVIFLALGTNRHFPTTRSLFRPLVLLLLPFMLITVNGIGMIKNEGTIYFEPRFFGYLLLYVVVFSIFMNVACRSKYEFAWYYVGIMLFQSICIYLAALNTSFRIFVFENLFNGDGRFDSSIVGGSRIVGIGMAGASGSILLFCGAALLAYLFIGKKINVMLFSSLFTFILGATALLGRTGFYFELLVLVYVLINTKGLRQKAIMLSVSGIIIVIGLLFIEARINPDLFSKIIKKIGEIFVPNTRYDTVQAILDMRVPQLTSETFWGTNVIRGTSASGVTILHDSGYVQNYFALGLLGALFYYFSILLVFIKGLKGVQNNMKIFIGLLIFVMFIIEIKEPFLMKYIFPFVLLTLILFENREVNNGEELSASIERSYILGCDR